MKPDSFTVANAMASAQVEATGTSYNALLGSQGGSWTMALVVLGEMCARRIPVDQVEG